MIAKKTNINAKNKHINDSVKSSHEISWTEHNGGKHSCLNTTYAVLRSTQKLKKNIF